MISDQTALYILTGSATTNTWRVRMGIDRLATVAALLRRVTTSIKSFAKAPVLPYAALLEASLLVSLLTEREHFEPDPFAKEMPLLTDSWPRL